MHGVHPSGLLDRSEKRAPKPPIEWGFSRHEVSPVRVAFDPGCDPGTSSDGHGERRTSRYTLLPVPERPDRDLVPFVPSPRPNSSGSHRSRHTKGTSVHRGPHLPGVLFLDLVWTTFEAMPCCLDTALGSNPRPGVAVRGAIRVRSSFLVHVSAITCRSPQGSRDATWVSVARGSGGDGNEKGEIWN